VQKVAGDPDGARELLAAYYEIRSLPIANAPTVSSVGTGEADPMERGVETAGAGESVAPREEVARLRREVESAVAAHAAESEAWVKATGASSPGEAAADAKRDGETWEKQRVEIAGWRTATGVDSPAAAKQRIDQLVADLALARENRAHFAEAASDRREKLRERPTQRAREPKEGDRVMFGSASGPHVAILLEFIPHAGPEGRGRVRDLETLEVHEAWPGDSLVRGTFKLID
jgi:hypothetical protein